jgi:hypothetical protein
MSLLSGFYILEDVEGKEKSPVFVKGKILVGPLFSPRGKTAMARISMVPSHFALLGQLLVSRQLDNAPSAQWAAYSLACHRCRRSPAPTGRNWERRRQWEGAHPPPLLVPPEADEGAGVSHGLSTPSRLSRTGMGRVWLHMLNAKTVTCSESRIHTRSTHEM